MELSVFAAGNQAAGDIGGGKRLAELRLKLGQRLVHKALRQLKKLIGFRRILGVADQTRVRKRGNRFGTRFRLGLGTGRRGLAGRFRLGRGGGLRRSRGFRRGGRGIGGGASAADKQQSTDQTKGGK